MTSLPQSIETYLIEAGFNATELLVLRRLLEDDAKTLRELASKTGKSTGVLDQATKKLINKRILKREIINGTPRYVLSSLEAIADWVKRDMHEKRDTLKRKQDDFESFIATLKKDQSRPEVRYFDGPEGMEQAYMMLLRESRDLLVYLPVTFKEEEDPLRVFRVNFFRERRRHGIFSRVITHNTPLGRRYQSRDPFEYRKTILVPEDDFPLTFEKIISGDTVACFNHATQKACLLHYPELAHTERGSFEMIWKTGQMQAAADPTAAKQTPPADYSIPISTKTISALRDFFLSRKSFLIFALGALAAGLLTYGISFRSLTDEGASMFTGRPLYYFLGFFFLFVLIRLAAFNRSLFRELLELFKNKRVYIPLGLYILASLGITYLLYLHNVRVNLQHAREQVESIAATGVLQLDPKDIEALKIESDWEKPEWAKVVNQLKEIREQNENVMFVYLFRKSENNPNELEFVADSHSLNPYANTDGDRNNDVDANQDDIIDDKGDFLQWPGQPYPGPPVIAFEAFNQSVSTQNFYTDSWGTTISGYAPLQNKKTNRNVAVLAVDIGIKRFKEITHKTFVPFYYFVGIFILFVIFRPAGLQSQKSRKYLRY